MGCKIQRRESKEGRRVVKAKESTRGPDPGEKRRRSERLRRNDIFKAQGRQVKRDEPPTRKTTHKKHKKKKQSKGNAMLIVETGNRGRGRICHRRGIGGAMEREVDQSDRMKLYIPVGTEGRELADQDAAGSGINKKKPSPEKIKVTAHAHTPHFKKKNLFGGENTLNSTTGEILKALSVQKNWIRFFRSPTH